MKRIRSERFLALVFLFLFTLINIKYCFINSLYYYFYLSAFQFHVTFTLFFRVHRQGKLKENSSILRYCDWRYFAKWYPLNSVTGLPLPSEAGPVVYVASSPSRTCATTLKQPSGNPQAPSQPPSSCFTTPRSLLLRCALSFRVSHVRKTWNHWEVYFSALLRKSSELFPIASSCRGHLIIPQLIFPQNWKMSLSRDL